MAKHMEIKLPTVVEFCKMNNMYPERETVDKNTDLLARYILDIYERRLHSGEICPVIGLDRYFRHSDLVSVPKEIKWQVVKSAMRRLQDLGYGISDMHIWYGKELQPVYDWCVKITANMREAKKNSDKRHPVDFGAICFLVLIALFLTVMGIAFS